MILGLVGIASFIAYATSLASGSMSGTLTTVALLLTYSTAALIALGAAVTRRGAWRPLLAAAVTGYAFSSALYTVDPAAASKFPSIDDLGLLIFYPCSLAAAFAFFRAKLPRLGWASTLDAAIVGVALATVGSALLRQGLESHAPAFVWGQLLYALGDLLLLGFLLTTAVLIRERRPLGALLFILGAAALGLGDCVYVASIIVAQQSPGILTSLCWPAGLLLLAGAAVTPSRATSAADRTNIRLSVIPKVAAFAYLPIAVIISHKANPAADALSAVGLALVILRLSLSETMNVRLLRRASGEVAERQRSELLLLEAQQLAGLGSWRRSVTSGEVSWSRQMYRIWGVDPALEAPSFGSLLEMVHPDDRATFEQSLQDCISGGEELCCELRITRPDGETRLVASRARLLKDQDGGDEILLGSTQDVTEQRQREHQLSQYVAKFESLAKTDPLTGLLNHRAFHELLDTEIERAMRDGGRMSVVMFDLDGFKLVNDGRGHAEGDRVLKMVAAALREGSRSLDCVCRIGGDEFAMLLPGCSAEDAADAARRMVKAVRSLKADVDVSFGVGEWPSDGPNKDALLFRADMELYAAKPARSERKRIAAVSEVAVTVTRQQEKQPPGGILTSDDDAAAAAGMVQRLLEIAREQLGMDVAYASEFTEGQQVFRALSGDSGSFGLSKDSGIPLADTYCQRMVAGELPSTIGDTARDPRVNRLQSTSEAGVGAYVGVPVRFSDGRLYGTLCCASHQPNRSLGQRDVAFMNVLARLLADQLERDALEHETKRLSSEATAVRVLLTALDARDHYTGEHSTFVIELAELVARSIGLDPKEVAVVRQLALLHDIGKLGVPDSILRKQSKLDPAEWQLMQEHSNIGARIVSSIPELAHLSPLIRADHERWDGSGYPSGLSGEEIPIPSRIVFACDAWHAMTSDRPYRRAMPIEAARRELQRNAGSQFDPVVVEVLIEVLNSRVAEDSAEAGRDGPLIADIFSAVTPTTS
ncbi:MAG: hypothetical protein NVSMB25_07120 [Thermoleophilaceae bacterium]